jgi:hypothetical protein
MPISNEASHNKWVELARAADSTGSGLGDQLSDQLSDQRRRMDMVAKGSLIARLARRSYAAWPGDQLDRRTIRGSVGDLSACFEAGAESVSGKNQGSRKAGWVVILSCHGDQLPGLTWVRGSAPDAAFPGRVSACIRLRKIVSSF